MKKLLLLCVSLAGVACLGDVKDCPDVVIDAERLCAAADDCRDCTVHNVGEEFAGFVCVDDDDVCPAGVRWERQP
jgi:hypothetical protein